MPNVGGRPTKLTPEITEKITDMLKAGGTRRSAFLTAGVAERTFCKWMAYGETAKRGRYLQFRQAVIAAEQHAIARNVVALNKMAVGGEVLESTTITRPDGSVVYKQKKSPPSFQAASWWLERRYPQDWGRREEITHRLPDGAMYGQINQQNIIVIEDRAGARRAAEAVNHNGRVNEVEPPEEIDDSEDTDPS